MGDAGGNGNLGESKKVDVAALGLAVVAEFLEGAAANEETVTSTTVTAASQNQNNVYFDKQEGSEATNGSSGDQNGDVATENHDVGEFNIQADSGQYVKTMEEKCSSSSEMPHLHNSSEVKGTAVKDFNDETSTNTVPDLIEEIDERLKERDVEAVLANQETHDLFCPNCHSCITKRVILRKRKRIVPNVDPKAKRDKSDPLVNSNLVDIPEYKSSQGDHATTTSDVGSQEPPADHYNTEREPEVFRCLSCFSFFIPSGNGFNIFRSFGGALKQKASESSSDIPTSNLQSSSNMPTSKANWFLSLLTSNKGKIASKQGDAALEHSETDTAKQNDSSSFTSNMLISSEISPPGGLVADATIVKNGKLMTGIKPEHEGLNSLVPSTVEPVKTELLIKENFNSNMTPGKDSLADQQDHDLFQNDSTSLQSSKQASSNLTNELQKVGNNLVDSTDTRKTDSEADIVAISSSMNLSGDKLPMREIDSLTAPVTGETLVNNGKAAQDAIVTNNAVINLQTAEANVKIPQIEKVNRDILEEIDPAVRKENQGGDVIVRIEAEADKSTTSQSADTVAVEGVNVTETSTQVLTDEQQRAEIGESQEWEILKSIVYGGLIESIASLGVVSSSVGAGAGTLNIIALGLANLIGGLFILGHNLIELKDDHPGDDLQQTNTQDQYQELLGHPTNFLLHAVVAVLSFLIFGAVPLVVYWEASGASYIAGSLIKDLLKKYIDSESSFVLNMPVFGRGSMDPVWMSY
ncbi:hypothetical protein L6164_030227 [Bauhinia variegata]|uniref:Uncharacterized protein n=1 Tax=Bauhinia variegata TaxID=167791 RepID=A0ACB9LBP6_BAUVA|nr:hypothetical protein L6164_030227 [Bauhinia variegata]